MDGWMDEDDLLQCCVLPVGWFSSYASTIIDR